MSDKGGKHKLHHLKSEADLQVMRRALQTHKNNRNAMDATDQLHQSGESSSSGSTVLLPDADGCGPQVDVDVEAESPEAGEVVVVGHRRSVDSSSSHPCSVSLLTFGIWEQHTAIKRRYTAATLDAAKANTYGRHLQNLYAKLTPEELVARLRDADTLFDQSDILHILYLEKYARVYSSLLSLLYSYL